MAGSVAGWSGRCRSVAGRWRGRWRGRCLVAHRAPRVRSRSRCRGGRADVDADGLLPWLAPDADAVDDGLVVSVGAASRCRSTVAGRSARPPVVRDGHGVAPAARWSALTEATVSASSSPGLSIGWVSTFRPELAQVGGDLVDVATDVVVLVDGRPPPARARSWLGGCPRRSGRTTWAHCSCRLAPGSSSSSSPLGSGPRRSRPRPPARAPAARAARGCAPGAPPRRTRGRRRAAACRWHRGRDGHRATGTGHGHGCRLGSGGRVAQRGGERGAVGVALRRVLGHGAPDHGGQVGGHRRGQVGHRLLDVGRSRWRPATRPRTGGGRPGTRRRRRRASRRRRPRSRPRRGPARGRGTAGCPSPGRCR